VNLFKQVLRILMMTRRVGGWKAATSLLQSLPKQFQLFRRLLGDLRVPISAKLVLIGAILFAVSPLNVPQYIPILGQLDDIGIALLAGSFFLKQVPLPVLAEHRHVVGLRDNLVEA